MMRLIAMTAVFCALASAASAQPANKTILVSSGDGYGTTECLASGSHCGQIVANSLCNRQGSPRAVKFGPARAEDLTGAIEGNLPASQAFVVTCQ
jgi:hypothetical protein